jgi:hypothetical protein
MNGMTLDFIRDEIKNQTYEISWHADEGRLADGISIFQLEFVLKRGEVLEDYPDDPRGHSCLVCGFTLEEQPVHVVCGKNRSGHLIIITVYIPTMPKWKDSHNRNR